MIYVKYIGDPPTKGREGDAGFDLTVSAACNLMPGKPTAVPMNLWLELPAGWCALAHPRTSNILRGVHVAGLIDPNYRGQLNVLCTNLTLDPIYLNPGDRVGQILILPVPDVRFVRVDSLTPSDRGDAWNGSSGK